MAAANNNIFSRTTRLSHDSSKNNILENLNEFFVSSKSINGKNKVGSGEMRRQRSEMLIDRKSHSVALKHSSSNNLFYAKQNRLDVPKVVRAMPAPY